MSINKEDDDLLKEFGLISEDDQKNNEQDLSKTMVVPRVEDLIEERPLQPATDAESLLAAVPVEGQVIGRRAKKLEEEKRLKAEKEAEAKRREEARSRAEAKRQEDSRSKDEARKKAEAEKKESSRNREESERKKNARKREELKNKKAEREKRLNAVPPTDSTDASELGEKEVKKKKKKKYKIHWGRLIAIICGFVLICCIGVGIWVYSIVKDAPEIYPDNIYDLLSENSIVYDCNGTVIDNIYSGDALRTNLEYKEMPKQLLDAFVSIEDKTFWDHHGFNLIRIAGAVWQKLSGQSDKIGGTSTITQQLARNLYLSEIKSERSMTRKITEAYYTLQLEKQLSKEQIIEAYLNTIYLGYNCNGVAAAAQAYFSKDVSDLELLECAQLAALPQSPHNYAPLKRAEIVNVDNMDALDIITQDEKYVVYYNDLASSRVKTVLYYMHDQGKIDDATYETAKADSIRNYLNPGSSAVNSYTTSYFVDYVKSQVLKDLIEAGYDKETANKLLYQGGLRINSTMDIRVQTIMDTEYDNPANFPGIAIFYTNKNGDIMNEEHSKILLYKAATFFNEDGDFVLGNDEYEWMPNGDLKVFSGKRLNIYRTSVAGGIDYSVEFKYLYEYTEDKIFYSRAGGVWNIEAKYKERDDDGNLILSSSYFSAFPEAFTKNEDGTITLSKNYFTLKQLIRQPQSAMVVMDYENGHILGMVGGREIEGKLLYNRATAPRQPGSSIKPLAVYSVALQKGKDGEVGYNAAMPIDDTPILNDYSIWPKNWYVGYRGITNLRNAVEQSINACAVNLYMKMADPMASISQLQKMGVTTLVTEGDVTDVNASSMALGGMTTGISPLEMTAAYGTFGNYGVYTEPICYTTVTTKNGDIVLSKTANQTKVLDEDVASLMTDILRTTVTRGLGTSARLKSQPSAGKTGTTSERYDIWFCGLTPQYSAACWIGSDVNIPINSDSSYVAKLWAKVMDQVGALTEREEFVMKGNFVTETVNKYTGGASEYSTGDDLITEIFIKGTEPSAVGVEGGMGYSTATVCSESGYLATPWCPSTYTTVGIVRPGGVSWERMLSSYKEAIQEAIDASYFSQPGKKSQNLDDFTIDSVQDAAKDLPDLYCPYHNMDTELYPVSSMFVVHEGSVIQEDIIDENPEDLLNPELSDAPTLPEQTDAPTLPEGGIVN